MKLHPICVRLALAGLFTLVLAAGCFAPDRPLEDTAVPVTQTVASTAAVPEITATVALPTRTASPTVVPPTPTITPPPTLNPEQREEAVRDLLQTNGSCALPCWWGITPGKTTWRETEDFLQNLGAVISVYPEESDPIFYETNGLDFIEEYIMNRVRFYEGDGVVKSIEVHGYGLTGNTDPDDFEEVWSQFAPEEIIAEYGTPTRVWVESNSTVSEGRPGPTMPYSLWIFYDHVGILVRYSGKVPFQETYRMCPTFQPEGDLQPFIDLYLRAEDHNIPLERLSDHQFISEESINSLEEAAGISLEEFAELYSQPVQVPCFETPREIWP